MSRQDISFSNIQKLAIPAILSGIVEPVLSSTDAAVMRNLDLHSTEALAAVGIVGTFLSAIIWILGQTRSAISSIINQNLGKENEAILHRFPMQTIGFNLLLSLFVFVTTFFFAKEIFVLMNAKNLVLDYSVSYFKIRVFGFPFTLITFAIFGIFRGLQNTFIPMVISIIGAVLNIVLDFALVYGYKEFIPALGVDGAAWASLIAQIVMMVLSVYYLMKEKRVKLKLSFPLDPEIKRFIPMSLNLFVRSIALNITLILSMRTATSHGDVYAASHSIAFNIWIFTAFFIDGYGAAGGILSGKLLGQKRFKDLTILVKKVLRYNLIIASILMFLFYLFSQEIGLLFSKEVEVLKVFEAIIWVVVLCLPVNAITFSMDAFFKGLGEMKYLRNVLLSATFLVFVPVLFLLNYMGWKLEGVWIALWLWIFVRGILIIFEFKRKFYKV